MRFLALTLMLAGCEPATAVIFDPDEADADTDTDADSDTDADTDPGPQPPTTWAGTRDFTFSTPLGTVCEDSIEEDGQDVTDNPEHADAVAACGLCEQVFFVQTDPDVLCEQVLWLRTPVASPIYRGVRQSSAGWDLYRIERTRDGFVAGLLATGEEVEGDIQYTYSGQLGINAVGYQVEGRVRLE